MRQVRIDEIRERLRVGYCNPIWKRDIQYLLQELETLLKEREILDEVIGKHLISKPNRRRRKRKKRKMAR